MDRINLCLAHMSGNEMQYIQEAFDTNWVVESGGIECRYGCDSFGTDYVGRRQG